jgi:hypothetical protein
VSVKLPNHLAAGLPVASVYGFLVHLCLSFYDYTAADVEKHWGMTADDAYSLGIRSVPTLVGNLVAAQACAARFGPDVLANVPGFYTFNRSGARCFCHEWNSLCVCDLPTWRIDIDFCWAKHGLILPQRSSRGWFESLKIFRHPQDARPFTLKVRREAKAA